MMKKDQISKPHSGFVPAHMIHSYFEDGFLESIGTGSNTF